MAKQRKLQPRKKKAVRADQPPPPAYVGSTKPLTAHTATPTVVEKVQVEVMALRARAMGGSYEDVAAQLSKLTSKKHTAAMARKTVMRALRRHVASAQEAASDVRDLMLFNYDQMKMALLKVAFDPTDKFDARERSDACGRILDIDERICELLAIPLHRKPLIEGGLNVAVNLEVLPVEQRREILRKQMAAQGMSFNDGPPPEGYVMFRGLKALDNSASSVSSNGHRNGSNGNGASSSGYLGHIDDDGFDGSFSSDGN